ncbi:hypothetical protein HJFPF1_13331 [Paramyrothecium foliicola]|nr:hypothetical protein HJFPF1_13331 [Paramyrothecium foliicola]
MFTKTAALFSLAAMVSGRVIFPNTTAPVLPPTMVPTPIIPTPIATPTPGPGPVGIMTGPCSDEGLWNCVDGASFQRCASGAWSVVQPMAAGTACKTGLTSHFEILPSMPHVPPTVPEPPVVPTPVQPVPTPIGTPGSTPLPGSPSKTKTGPCKHEGMWNCVDGTSFQRCASGAWSVLQPMAPGTKCKAGASADFNVLPMRSFMHKRRRILI